MLNENHVYELLGRYSFENAALKGEITKLIEANKVLEEKLAEVNKNSETKKEKK